MKSKIKQVKKQLLKRFFNFYLCTLLGSEMAVEEYLASLRRAYSQLKEGEKFTLNEVEESINEMEVDEQSKSTLIQLVARQTNFTQLDSMRGQPCFEQDAEMSEC